MERQANRVPMLMIGEAGPECFVPFPLSDSVDKIESTEDWECEYCGKANQSSRLECIGCGGPKGTNVPESILFTQGIISAAQWEQVRETWNTRQNNRERLYFGGRIWR